MLVIEAGSLRHLRRGPSDAPVTLPKKSLRPERGRPKRWLQAPLFYAAFGMPFSGRGPVFVAFPGAALALLPPYTMAEAFGLKCCKLPQREIHNPVSAALS